MRARFTRSGAVNLANQDKLLMLTCMISNQTQSITISTLRSVYVDFYIKITTSAHHHLYSDCLWAQWGVASVKASENWILCTHHDRRPDFIIINIKFTIITLWWPAPWFLSSSCSPSLFNSAMNMNAIYSIILISTSSSLKEASV